MSPDRPGGADVAERLADRLAPLRASFDLSFMEPPRPAGDSGAHLLAIRSGGRPYALWVADTAGLFTDRPVTALPGPLPALLGVATFRGAVVPVYELAAVLGHPTGGVPRWLVLVAGTPALALAFDALDGHLRLPPEAVVRYGEDTSSHQWMNGMARLPGRTLGVVDLAAVRASIHTMTAHLEGSRRR
ncbi:hypothetical protein GCM10010124_16310 [Pilimelia terevasa]|uniref:CheW-like domain-containing protein n=1 Tax=Pilimelia terevasa TaxID=53372 RepID=A0A8J3BM63_9ACTN|nr:chemotaxis protein CheW [Pilimelia terevasa]GGK24532.1 hypothetical protein GCM10010124_16310 [Pilimelia terevasa]